MRYFCPSCTHRFSYAEADTISVPDDRDQMHDRPLSGTRDVMCCPMCGYIEIEEDECAFDESD